MFSSLFCFYYNNASLRVTCASRDSIIGSPSNPRREDPENFLVIFGAFNISDVTDEQVIGIDMIIKVRITQDVPYTF